MNILSENEDPCAQAPKKEAPCIPIAEARGFTTRNDNSKNQGVCPCIVLLPNKERFSDERK